MHRVFIFCLCLCAALVALAPAAAAKRVALVVGIDGYDNLAAQEQLQKAVNDARTIGEALKTVGYEVIAVENADRRSFNASWQKFLSRIEPGDEAAFFFAGHGIEIAGQNYLLPSDIPKPQSGEASLIKNESLSVTQLLVDLQEEGPRVSLVILDACRDNPFAASGVRSIGGTRGLTRVEAPEGSFVMYSAGTGQTALDRLSDTDDNPNSIFTRSLAPLIKTKGLGLQEVALKVREEVVALANSAGRKQTPAYYDQVIGRFCPAGCEGGEVAAVEPQAVVPPAPAPAPSPPQQQSAQTSSCALKDAVYHTAKTGSEDLAFVPSASEESVTGADMVLKAAGTDYRFELVIENGTGNEYAILSGQGDNEDPPSSELISVVNGKESPGVGALEAGAPDQILLPDLQKSFMKQNGGPSAEGYVPSGTLWQRSCPGTAASAAPAAEPPAPEPAPTSAGERLAAVAPAPSAAVAEAPAAELRSFDETPLVWSLAFSPDATVLASADQEGDNDHQIKLWDVATAKVKAAFKGHSNRIAEVAFSPDGALLASASEDDSIGLWDLSAGKMRRSLKGHGEDVESVAFSPDGTRIASGGSDKAIRLWDVKTGKQIRVFEGQAYTVSALSFSPDGSRIASSGWADGVTIWDVASGKALSTFSPGPDYVDRMAFAPDWRRAATATDKELKLWDPASGTLLWKAEHGADDIDFLAFSPDGSLVVSANDDAVKLWDAVSGALKQTIDKPLNTLTCVAFSSDGSLLAIGGGDIKLLTFDKATASSAKP
jgi:hypothetical protein